MSTTFHIREAHPEDAFGMAKVRVDTWRIAYRGLLSTEHLASLSYQVTADRWREAFWHKREPGVQAFVAETDSGEIVGIAVCGPEKNQHPIYRGEIYVLYVLPEVQNLGIGRQLVAACVQHLVGKLNLHTMLVWVMAENPYRRFYESLGGKLVGEKDKEIGGMMVREVSYGWEDIANGELS